MNRVLLIASAALLASCSSSKTTLIDANTAVVSVRGSTLNTHEGVFVRTLVNAAKAAKERGGRYFVVSSADDTTTTGMGYLPGQSTTDTSGTAYCSGMHCVGQATSTTSTMPGYAIPMVRPGMRIVVNFFADRATAEATGRRVWDADEVLALHKK